MIVGEPSKAVTKSAAPRISPIRGQMNPGQSEADPNRAGKPDSMGSRLNVSIAGSFFCIHSIALTPSPALFPSTQPPKTDLSFFGSDASCRHAAVLSGTHRSGGLPP